MTLPNATPREYVLDGRRCVSSSRYRVRDPGGTWALRAFVAVRFLDDRGRVVEDVAMSPARFHRTARPTGRRLVCAGGKVYEVLEEEVRR